MFLGQEPKYMALGSNIVNRATRQPIPSDEPVFVFRAKDQLAIIALQAYAASPLTENHRHKVLQRITDFERFANEHPDRMRLPDTREAPAPAAGMTVLDPGHLYQLTGGHLIQFIKKVRVGEDFVTVADGTTNEELIDVLINRINTLNAAMPCEENADAVLHLMAANTRLQARTAARQAQQVEGTDKPHNSPAPDVIEQHGILMTPVPKSSNLEAYGYRESDNTLQLRFKGGKVYQYPQFPADKAAALAAAESKGSYVAREITPVYMAVPMPATSTLDKPYPMGLADNPNSDQRPVSA